MELTTREAQRAHYDAVRRRIVGEPQRVTFKRPVAPVEDEPPLPTVIRWRAQSTTEPVEQPIARPIKRVIANEKTFRRIAAEVARRHGLTVEAMLSANRKVALVKARFELFYEVCTRYPQWGYGQVAKLAGHMDHTVAFYGARKWAERNNLPPPPARGVKHD